MNTHTTERMAYGIKEACQAASVGRSFLYEQIKAGKLKSFTIGNRRLIASDDLEAWIEGYRNHAV